MRVPEPPAWLHLLLGLSCCVAVAATFVSELLGFEVDRATTLALVACGVSFLNSYELRERN